MYICLVQTRTGLVLSVKRRIVTHKRTLPQNLPYFYFFLAYRAALVDASWFHIDSLIDFEAYTFSVIPKSKPATVAEGSACPSYRPQNTI